MKKTSHDLKSEQYILQADRQKHSIKPAIYNDKVKMSEAFQIWRDLSAGVGWWAVVQHRAGQPWRAVGGGCREGGKRRKQEIGLLPSASWTTTAIVDLHFNVVKAIFFHQQLEAKTLQELDSSSHVAI